MRKHSFDPTSFILGLVVAGVALAYLVAEGTDRSVDGAWVFPVALIGLGVAAVAAGLSRALRRDPRVAADQEPDRADAGPVDADPSDAEVTTTG